MTAHKLTPATKFTLIRTACNAWRTATRFHSSPNKCLFGCRQAPDALPHYLICPTIRDAALNTLHLDLDHFAHDSPATFFNPIHRHRHIQIISHITATHYAFEAARKGASTAPPHQLYTSAIKHLAAREPLVHRYLTNPT